MRVSGLGGNPAWGKGGEGAGGAERAGKDGQRKGGQGEGEGQERKPAGDQVQLQGKGEGAVEPVERVALKKETAGKGRPPLDLSA